MSELIDEIARLVEQACAAAPNIYGYSIWTHHIQKVAHHGRRLAIEAGADPEIVEIAALLHDFAAIKDPALAEDHHIHGQQEAEKVLHKLGYPAERIQAVQHCIASHRGSVQVERRTLEAACLANADAITHLEQIPALLHLCFTQQKMNIDEGTDWVRRKLDRTWQKMDGPTQEKMRPTYEEATRVLDRALAG